MKIQLRFFASLREALGGSATLEVADGSTVGQLRDVLIASSPRHAEVLARGRAVRCAVNQVMCDDGAALPADAEVAFFPPVTGG
ncbi:MAG: MoaD/ThiS family protein [Rubrivivax sp.]|nr:MoaD/ThiS family protein [Rubrivivax sp.]